MVRNVGDLGNRPRNPGRNVRDVGEFGGSAGG
jgi:hypothetical protein